MIDTPHVWWLSVVLAIVLFADAVVSLRPPAIIRGCLDGVGFPREWWWSLVVVKLSAAAGLVAGLNYPGVGIAATVGVAIYFVCATYAHVRARFLKQEFWLNCLGMLALTLVVLVVSYRDLVAA